MDDDQIQDRWCQDCDTVVPISEDHDCNCIYVSTSTNSSNSTSNTSNKNDYSERLIAAVFEREILWNSKLPYKLRGPLQTKLLWSDIDTCLGTTPGTSQIKWKSLRDRFVKEHTIECAYVPSGSAAVKRRSSWPLYESLRFLVPTINYRKTTSNIENINPNMLSSSTKKAEHVILSIPSVSNIKKEMQYNQEKNKNTLLKPQLLPSKQIYSRQNSTNSDTISGLVHQSKCSNSVQSTLDAEALVYSPVPPKRIKKLTTVENTDIRFEEAVLKELEQTRPKNEPENKKPDKIASFSKYIETCLREMTENVSKRVMNKILTLLLEEDM